MYALLANMAQKESYEDTREAIQYISVKGGCDCLHVEKIPGDLCQGPGGMRIPGETLSLGHVLQRQSSVDTLPWGQAFLGRHSPSDKFFHANALPWGHCPKNSLEPRFPSLAPHTPPSRHWSGSCLEFIPFQAEQFIHLPLLENSVPSPSSKVVPPRDDMTASLKPHCAGSSLSPGYAPSETSLMKGSPEEGLSRQRGVGRLTVHTGWAFHAHRSTANTSMTRERTPVDSLLGPGC